MRRSWLLIVLGIAFVGCSASGTVDDEGEPLGYPDAGMPDDDVNPDETTNDDVKPPIEECATGLVESGGVCVVDKGSRWDLVVLEGRFETTDPDGDDWDLSGGNPDGYVWIEFGFEPFEVETDPIDEKLNPAWNQTLIWSVSAAELRAHFDLRLYDFDKYDLSGDDLQASCEIVLPDEVFGLDEFNALDVDAGCPDVRLALRLAK